MAGAEVWSPSTKLWALWSNTQASPASAELASTKRLLACSWWLTCLVCSGTTHEVFLRGHLTILHRECTRGLLSMVGRHCRLPFPTLRFLTFETLQHFTLFHFSPSKLSRLFLDSLHLIPLLGVSDLGVGLHTESTLWWLCLEYLTWVSVCTPSLLLTPSWWIATLLD